MILIKPKEIREGGGVDEGMTFGYGSCGNLYYKCWMIPVFGQDSEKLAKKSINKVAIKLKDKADKAAEMLSRMNIGQCAACMSSSTMCLGKVLQTNKSFLPLSLL